MSPPPPPHPARSPRLHPSPDLNRVSQRVKKLSPILCFMRERTTANTLWT